MEAWNDLNEDAETTITSKIDATKEGKFAGLMIDCGTGETKLLEGLSDVKKDGIITVPHCTHPPPGSQKRS